APALGGRDDLHPARRIHRREPERPVDVMGVAGREAPAPDGLEASVVEEGAYHLAREPAPAVARGDEDVAEPRERRLVGDHAGDADLALGLVVGADGKAVRERALDDVAPDARRPVRVTQPGVDAPEIQAGGI